ncbi:MAG TPA: iron-containing alcohol dehydrogenase family protein [Acetivibrio clariflavus]|nr:iron-containing alcohol dehydrogenase family protein [Acetivibrio clariflavus]HPU41572.1 iron-containing alcohol dehydrogenase family protein [Acetivibrio clariflavus]
MKPQTHRISIPVIMEVGPNKLEELDRYILKSGIKKIVLFIGEGIRDLFGDIIFGSLNRNKGLKVLEENECDDNSMEYITSKAFSIPADTEAIVGIGGGKVLDVAKYVAFLRDLPFISVPTSTAHDGFASSGCSLYINGHRTSVHARMPYGIIVDTAIIKKSPERFIYSGLGDIVSKITAVYDWLFEEEKGVTRVDDLAVMIAKKSVNSIVRMPYTDIKEDFFIKELVDSLTMSGIAMEIASNSSPASGSEHLISHALDKMTLKPQLHGIQVGIASYIMSLVQNHRFERIRKFLSDTGFFSYVKTLKLNPDDYIKAIDMAPDIKPNRMTYIHVPEYREKAKEVIFEDSILKDIFNIK